MKTLLRIDSSPRIENSDSRKIADYFEKIWSENNTDGYIIKRDLGKQPITHIQDNTIKGFYSDPKELTKELQEALNTSDEVISEIEQSDEIFISTPLYNFGIPSALKAYIDHLVRINKTFGMDEEGNFYGMLENKNVYVGISKGAVYKNTPIESLDMLEPYLKLILPFVGLNLKGIYSVEGTTTDLNHSLKTFEETKLEINKLFN